MTVRLNVNVNDDTKAALEELSAKHGTTVTEEFRRAVSVFKFVDDQMVEGTTIKIVPNTSNPS